MTFTDRYGAARITRDGQGYADALGALDDVSIGYDIAGGVDDHSRADGVLAHDKSGLRPILFVYRAIAGYEDLNYCGRYFGSEAFQGVVELSERSRGIVEAGLWFFSRSARGGGFGGLLRRRLLRQQTGARSQKSGELAEETTQCAGTGEECSGHELALLGRKKGIPQYQTVPREARLRAKAARGRRCAPFRKKTQKGAVTGETTTTRTGVRRSRKS